MARSGRPDPRGGPTGRTAETDCRRPANPRARAAGPASVSLRRCSLCRVPGSGSVPPLSPDRVALQRRQAVVQQQQQQEIAKGRAIISMTRPVRRKPRTASLPPIWEDVGVFMVPAFRSSFRPRPYRLSRRGSNRNWVGSHCPDPGPQEGMAKRTIPVKPRLNLRARPARQTVSDEVVPQPHKRKPWLIDYSSIAKI